jgi:hypothetical protein
MLALVANSLEAHEKYVPRKLYLVSRQPAVQYLISNALYEVLTPCVHPQHHTAWPGSGRRMRPTAIYFSRKGTFKQRLD